MEEQYINNDPIILKLVIRDLMANLESDKRISLKPWINNLFEDPVIMFDETYERFTGGLGQNADAMDQWVTLQMSFLSDLGEGRKVILQRFIELFEGSVKSLPGGQGFTIAGLAGTANDSLKNSSYLVALIIRVYGAMVDVAAVNVV